ncbi:FGGY family carbohydrate kinase, partial [Yoonia sp.]|uniref:FGGY family carbohydrate kinase n=1 Tax=Yoonia sp. TaxID=2212373 RepID=UPI003A4D517A
MTNDNTAVAQPAAHFIGIDVGTGSARAGVFDGQGRLVGSDNGAISTHYENGGIVEQSSAEIWGVVCAAVRGAVTASGVDPAQIKGIGFDATCSLVVLGKDGTPLPVGAPERTDHDIVVWMDHRAVAQAARINDTKHNVLDYVGGRISPEMQTPKLLWLKENRPALFESVWQFFDLTDFLTWRATGSLARSNCTLTCKWTYLGHEKRWDESYFRTIGLGVLADEGFRRIGTQVVDPGTAVGAGLTKDAAQDLGLLPGTAVAAGL